MNKPNIAHRGNLNGPNPEEENRPEYIKKSIALHFQCEVDVWKIENDWFLGHDEPKYRVDFKFFKDHQHDLWLHCKNEDALYYFYRTFDRKDFNFFWHDTEKYILTSRGDIWCYPSKEPIFFGINLMPEWNNLTRKDLKNCRGICSDYILKYK